MAHIYPSFPQNTTFVNDKPIPPKEPILFVDCHIDTLWQYVKKGASSIFVRNKDIRHGRTKNNVNVIPTYALYSRTDYGDFDVPGRADAFHVYETELTTFQYVVRGTKYLGMENGMFLSHPQNNKDVTQFLHTLCGNNVKYLTLTHNFSTSWANSATDARKHDEGLTPYGIKVIQFLNDVGILPDISHVADCSAEVTIKESEGPVIASHSGCRRIFNHVRNLPDWLIRLVSTSGGLIGVPLVKNFIGTKEKVFDHIDHIIQVCGHDRSIAIGSDLDGAVLVDGLENGYADIVPFLLEGLAQRGYVEKTIRNIMGLNALGILGQSGPITSGRIVHIHDGIDKLCV